MPADTHQQCAADLLRLLSERRDLFAQLLERSRAQAELIGAGDTDGLLRMLGEKQRLIAKNEELERPLSTLVPRWEAMREGAAPSVRRPIEQVMEECRGLMTEIVRLENQARADLQGAKSAADSQMGRMQTGKAMLKAYGAKRPPPPTEARFHDNQS